MNARSLAAASAAVLVLGAASSAGAGSSPGAQPTGVQGRTAAQDTGSDPYLEVELAFLGIDKKTLLAKLKQGLTLAQIATAQGKSPQGLIDALVAAAKVKLDAQVKAGTLSKAKETAALTKLRAQAGTFVTKSFGSSVKIPAVYLTPIVAYLQISAQTLEQELKSGKTLAQIAVEHGKTAAGVTAAILGAIQAQLDAQVTAGKLTASDRDALLAQARSTVAKLVAGTA
jgi:cyanate lyase